MKVCIRKGHRHNEKNKNKLHPAFPFHLTSVLKKNFVENGIILLS